MKLIRSDGKELTGWDIGPPIYRLTASGVPIKLHGHFLLEDEAARALLRDLAKANQNDGVGPQPATGRDRPTMESPK